MACRGAVRITRRIPPETTTARAKSSLSPHTADPVIHSHHYSPGAAPGKTRLRRQPGDLAHTGLAGYNARLPLRANADANSLPEAVICAQIQEGVVAIPVIDIHTQPTYGTLG